MTWNSLSSGLAAKARVLAGPMLRKVTPSAVTVWVALRTPCNVVLKVYDGENRVLEGARHTVAIGLNLHLVAVTATVVPPASNLSPGKIYTYDMAFQYTGPAAGLVHTLGDATAHALLSYPPYTRPSFCLPPADLNQLRILHGSCRIPHGEGTDALPLADALIEQAANNPQVRPHQLLMTGDQIYADDVSDVMALVLNDAGEALLGWTEDLPCNTPGPGSLRPVTGLHPTLREVLAHEASLPSVDIRGHMMGLGEFLAMYLFVWSDVLWPSDPWTLPSFEELCAEYDERISEVDEEVLGTMVGLDESRRGAVATHTAALQHFRSVLPKVRRALANIPSYMIFDDHEVTDDWNMTRDICAGIYGSDIGLRIVQNALVAYALCQHWGNVPEQFENTTPAPPGLALLTLLDAGNAAKYAASSADLRKRLGVHDHNTLKAQTPYRVFHGANSLTYNYTVEGPGHQIIVTDTRSWRSFPGGGGEAPELLPQAQLDAQIVNTPATGNRMLLVVISTNAPPVLPIRAATAHPKTTNAFKHYPDIYEAWELPSNATDRLIKAISNKLPKVSGQRVGCAVLLSGDVHFSFASRLLVKGTARFEDPQNAPQPVHAVIAQLVASSFRKQTSETVGFHREGYRFTPYKVTGVLIPKLVPESYLGWNLPAGTRKKVGHIAMGSVAAPMWVTGAKTLRKEDGWTVALTVPADYRYRFDYVRPWGESTVPWTPQPIPPTPAGATPAQRKQAAEAFHKATGSYRTYNAQNVTKRQVVGVNNLSEVTFEWPSNVGSRRVHHTARWRDPASNGVQFTTYAVSLDHNDPFYPIEPTP